MNITIIGNDPRLRAAQKALAGADVSGSLYLLPIPTERPGTLPVLSGISPGAGDTVVGYGIGDARAAAFARDGARVFDLERDETFLLENAELTALGVLYHLTAALPRAPRDESIGILGCGRVGRALLKLFCYLGARLSVYTTKTEDKEALPSLGVSVYPSRPFCPHGEDVLINTAPAPLLSPEVFGEKPPLIFDVASGENVPDSLGAQRLPALPVKLFRESAARVYLSAVRRAVGGDL